MFILITFILLSLSISAIVGLRLARLSASYTWLITIGVLLIWVSILLWQFNLPWRFMPGQWMSAGLFNASPQLFASSTVWLYALSLIALVVAVVLTSPARIGQVGTSSWTSILALAALGLLALLVNNPLGVALAWMAFDLTEFALVLRKNAAPGERIWFSFAIRLIATAFILWAGVVGTAASGQAFSFENTPAQAGIYLVIAASLRLAALPLVLSHQPDQTPEQRGFETILYSVSALTGLIIFARIPAAAMDASWLLALLTVAALAALFCGWKWLFAVDELQARSYWLIGMGALSLAACLGNNPRGAAAWGVCLVLFGGISFLYSTKQIWVTRILALMSVFLLSVPFTLTAAGWLGTFPFQFVFLPILVFADALLAAGFLRHILRPTEADFTQLPNWSQTTYVLGMGMLVLTILLGSVWGWPGAFNAGNWVFSIAVLLISGAMFFASVRLPKLALFKPLKLRIRRNRPVRFQTLLNIFVRIFSFIYQLIGSLTLYISDLLEGDGGLLWTLLLLILLISFLRGR